jgi:hypothetical protein
MSDLPFYFTFNSGFCLSLSALIFGFAGVAIKGCYQSKCRKCNVCGLIKIEHDIEAEEAIDLHKPKSTKDESKL